jgi:hypothetical protein
MGFEKSITEPTIAEQTSILEIIREKLLLHLDVPKNEHHYFSIENVGEIGMFLYADWFAFIGFDQAIEGSYRLCISFNLGTESNLVADVMYCLLRNQFNVIIMEPFC